MVEQRTLTPLILVRIQVSQPISFFHIFQTLSRSTIVKEDGDGSRRQVAARHDPDGALGVAGADQQGRDAYARRRVDAHSGRDRAGSRRIVGSDVRARHLPSDPEDRPENHRHQMRPGAKGAGATESVGAVTAS